MHTGTVCTSALQSTELTVPSYIHICLFVTWTLLDITAEWRNYRSELQLHIMSFRPMDIRLNEPTVQRTEISLFRAAYAHVDSSHGQPFAWTHCRVDSWPCQLQVCMPIYPMDIRLYEPWTHSTIEISHFRAAYARVLPSRGHIFARHHYRIESWPFSAAYAHELPSHGHPYSCNYPKASSRPCLVASLEISIWHQFRFSLLFSHFKITTSPSPYLAAPFQTFWTCWAIVECGCIIVSSMFDGVLEIDIRESSRGVL